MPKCSESINIREEDEEKLGTCANNHARPVWQRNSTRKQDRDMFPRYLYSSQISNKVTKTTRV